MENKIKFRACGHDFSFPEYHPLLIWVHVSTYEDYDIFYNQIANSIQPIPNLVIKRLGPSFVQIGHIKCPKNIVHIQMNAEDVFKISVDEPTPDAILGYPRVIDFSGHAFIDPLCPLLKTISDLTLAYFTAARDYDIYKKISEEKYNMPTKDSSSALRGLFTIKKPAKIVKVRFNGPVTIVTFDDNTTVKVRHNDDKTFDLEIAILYALFEKNFGGSKSAAHKELKRLVADAEKASIERINKKAKKEAKKRAKNEGKIEYKSGSIWGEIK